MGPEAAVNAVYANKIAAIDDEAERAAFVAEQRAEYEDDVDLLRLGVGAGRRRRRRRSRTCATSSSARLELADGQGPGVQRPAPRRPPGMSGATRTAPRRRSPSARSGPATGCRPEAPVPVRRPGRLDRGAASTPGVRIIEVAAFVSPKAVPAMAGAAEVMAALPRSPAVRHVALVPNVKGAELAAEAGVDALT